MRCHRTMVSTSVLSWDGGVRVIGNSTDCGTLWDMLAYNHRQNKKRDEGMPEKDKKIGDLRQQTGDLKRSASQMEMDFFFFVFFWFFWPCSATFGFVNYKKKDTVGVVGYGRGDHYVPGSDWLRPPCVVCLFFLDFFLMRLYRALRGCSCGSRVHRAHSPPADIHSNCNAAPTLGLSMPQIGKACFVGKHHKKNGEDRIGIKLNATTGKNDGTVGVHPLPLPMTTTRLQPLRAEEHPSVQ